MSVSTNSNHESFLGKVKEEIKSEAIQIKQEILKTKTEPDFNKDLMRIKNESIESLRLKQECIEAAKVKEELIPNLTRKDTEPLSDPEQTEKTEISHGLPKQTSKPRPKRPKRSALSLEKIASVDTEDLFVYNSENNTPLKKRIASIQEMSANEPIIETEEDRYPSEFSAQVKRKRRQNIDVLFDKYDSGIGILNEDGSIDTDETFHQNKVETLPEIHEDTELDILLSRPKKFKSSRGLDSLEKSEIDAITEKYDFLDQSTKHLSESVSEFEDIQLNWSLSKEFTVRIKCSRCVYSFQTRNDSTFEDVIERLAQKLEVDANKIMLTLKDDTVSPSDTPLSINLEENSIVDAIILSTAILTQSQPDEPKIKIKIQFSKQLGGQIPILAPLNTELNGILDQICESKNFTEKFQLQFDGEILNLSSTLQDYEIEDDDVIDAIMVT